MSELLSDEALLRHARHLSLAEVGEPGQLRLAKTLVNLAPSLWCGPRLEEVLRRAGVGELLASATPTTVLGVQPGSVFEFNAGVFYVPARPSEMMAAEWMEALVANEVLAVALGWRLPSYLITVVGATHRIVARR